MSRLSSGLCLSLVMYLGLCLGHASCADAADVPDVAKFLKQYRAEAKQIELAYRGIELKTEEYYVGRPDEKLVTRFLANKDCVRRDVVDFCAVATPQRSFAVEPSTQPDKFILRRIAITKEGYEKELADIRLKCELIHFPFSFYETRLIDLLTKDPECRVDCIKEDMVDGKPAFTVHVEQTMDEEKRQLELTFPVQRPWVVRKRKLSLGDRSKIWEMQYENSINGVPLPKELSCYSAVDGKVTSKSYSVCAVELSMQAPSPSEFTLARFGIEDVFGQRRDSWPWTIIGCGVVSIVLGVWIRGKLRNV